MPYLPYLMLFFGFLLYKKYGFPSPAHLGQSDYPIAFKLVESIDFIIFFETDVVVTNLL